MRAQAHASHMLPLVERPGLQREAISKNSLGPLSQFLARYGTRQARPHIFGRTARLASPLFAPVREVVDRAGAAEPTTQPGPVVAI